MDFVLNCFGLEALGLGGVCIILRLACFFGLLLVS